MQYKIVREEYLILRLNIVLSTVKNMLSDY